MNCLTEALGLSLPGNGSTLATHAERKRLFVEAAIHRRSRPPLLRAGGRRCPAARHRELCRLRERHDARQSPWAAPPTRCCTCSPRARGRGGLHHGRHRPPVAPGSRALQGRALDRQRPYGGTSTGPAASWAFWASSTAPACSTPRSARVHAENLGAALDRWDIKRTESQTVRDFFRAAPGACRRRSPSARTAASTRWTTIATTASSAIWSMPSRATAAWRCSTANLAEGRLHREDGGRRRVDSSSHGRARVFEIAGRLGQGDPVRPGRAGDVVLTATRGRAAAGHARNALSHELSEVEGPRKGLRPRHRRALLRRLVGPVDRPVSPEAAEAA